MVIFGREVSFRDTLDKLIVFCAALWLIEETIYGYLQVLGLTVSSNPRFRLTGHFVNPGPFGGFVAVMISIILPTLVSEIRKKDEKDYSMLVVTGIATLLGIIILPSSGSRTAIIGLLVASAVYLWRNRELLQLKLNRKGIMVLLISGLIFCFLICFGIKKESAFGRFHIWRIESRVIADNPLVGVGKDKYLQAYGLEQAEFFAEKERPALVKRVAGCPEFAFNEYLRLGMEYGLLVLLLVLGLTVSVLLVLFQRGGRLSYGAVCFAVFAFASYPLSLWQFKVLLAIIISSAALHAPQKQLTGIILCVIVLTISVGADFYNRKTPAISDCRSLYSQGYFLFNEGRYVEALDCLSRGAELSSDPMFHNIIGRCYEALGRYESAEYEYKLSHYMVPSRLYPLVLMKEMYESLGREEDARKIFLEIERTPVNFKNYNMVELRERAEK